MFLPADLTLVETLLFTTYALYFIGMTGIILLDNKPAQSTIAWLLTVYFLPFLGLFIYLFAGINWKKRKILRQRPEESFRQELSPLIAQQSQFIHKLDTRVDSDIRKMVLLLLHSNHSIITLHNQVKLYHHGKPFFEQLKTDLAGAQHFIHLEFFIWKSDALGREIRDILVAKARAGVEVRLIFDGVGCFWRMTRSYKQSLKDAGIEFRIFLDPLNLLTGGLANYLNHRKIVVIDGQIGYLGGMNIGMEYITGEPHFKYWRDTGLRFGGEIVQQLQTIFATDWFNSSHQWLKNEKYFPPLQLSPEVIAEQMPIQLACSGPDSDWYSIKQLFFSLIINADREVYIQSPYFIPDEGIAIALDSAALSGIEIHLMMAGIPDKWVPYWAAETYFERLLEAGCHIYRYQRGFLHCKTIIVDEMMASVGTCNLDVRSFELDYEVNAMIYEPEIAQELKQQFYADLAHSREITLADLKNIGLLTRLRNSFLRIFSPLL